MITRNSSRAIFRSLFLLAGFITYVCCPIDIGVKALAQSVAANSGNKQSHPANDASNADSGEELFQSIYRNFYETYRLGPGDVIAVRVYGQPDYALPQAKISPVGRIYHPLVGEVEVAGFTVGQLEKKLTEDFSEYVREPKVTVSLEEAQSAKVGVLGEIKSPGIVIMARPMTVLEAISDRGGFTDTAKKNPVLILRQLGGGRTETIKVDVKKILEGKADPEENMMVRAGDTIIIDSNLRKKLTSVMAVAGFAQFLTFIAFGRG
ncbi:MAG: polysaccharide biosynthesis/export family protein [Blastocatellales bacterium]